MNAYRLISGIFILMFLQTSHIGFGRTISVTSPDKKLSGELELGNDLTFSIKKGKQIIIDKQKIFLQTTTTTFGIKPVFDKKREFSVNTIVKGNFYKKTNIPNVYNEVEITLKGGYGIIIRAFNNGVAYRWFTTQKGRMTILDEGAGITLPANYAEKAKLYLTQSVVKDKFHSFEGTFDTIAISKADPARDYFLPSLLDLQDGCKVFFSESDVEDYPNLTLLGDESNRNSLKSSFAKVPKKIKAVSRHNKEYDLTRPLERFDYIAETDGDRHFPWRVYGVFNNDIELANFDLIYLLARPSKIDDLSWIKPGKVAWDWWHDWYIPNQNFKIGMNTDTYKYMIDFAAEAKCSYIVVDEGWNENLGTLMKPIKEMNIPELVAYGKEKGVGILLWGTAFAADKEMDVFLDHYAKMGVKGFKIDFFDRDDQIVVRLAEKLLAEAAKRKLIIDYHGVFKPTGLERTYPNEVNREGIYGYENNKWTDKLTPRQEILLALIRGGAGHSDFTPGGMRNVPENHFKPNWAFPMAKGTRTRQLAHYVIFHGPLQMLSDAPVLYRNAPVALDFLKIVPTTFEEMVPVSVNLESHYVVAKRQGDTWYIAAIGPSKELKLEIKLDFLKEETYDATIWKDGLNAERFPEEQRVEETQYTKGDVMKINLAPTGGMVAVLKMIPRNK